MLGRVFGRRSRASRLTDTDVTVVADEGLGCDDVGHDSADAGGRPVSRRGLLRWGGMAAAGAAAAGIVTELAASPAGASNGTALTAGSVVTAENSTTLNYDGVSTSQGCLFLANDTTFTAADATFPAAVAGWTDGGHFTNGVYGYTTAAGGNGVVGVAAGGGVGVRARAFSGSGIEAASSSGRGAVIQSNTNQALWAKITQSNNAKAVIRAETPGAGPGINSVSALGAGGLFSGKTAQIQLVPSTASTHPASGTAGQLFVDKSNRLWFCKGGASWHQLA
jgi:hypothetical protein